MKKEGSAYRFMAESEDPNEESGSWHCHLLNLIERTYSSGKALVSQLKWRVERTAPRMTKKTMRNLK